MQLTGATAAAALLAGCGDGGGPEDGGGDGGNDTGGDNDTGGGNDTGGNETADNETDGNETADNETDGNETADGGGGGAIEPGTEILFSAETSAWVGVEPEDIADEENPTITLQEGEDYSIGWEEGDGAIHNIEIRDENDEVVEDYQTEESEEGGDDQILDITASSEMASYVCNPHENTMNGEIQVE